VDCAEGLTDGVEQVEPERLRVVLVAAHLHDGEPTIPGRTFGPGAQQRRLAAAGRRGDHRHLPRGHAVEAGDELVAGNRRLGETHGGHRSREPAERAVDNRHLTINRVAAVTRPA
jgi:hypothetical protein